MQFNTYQTVEDNARAKLVDLSLTKEREYREQNKIIIVASGSTINANPNEGITSLESFNVPLTELVKRVSGYDVLERLRTPSHPDNSQIHYDLEFNLYLDHASGLCRLNISIGNLVLIMNNPNETVLDTIKQSDVDLTDQATHDTLIRLSKGLDIIK